MTEPKEQKELARQASGTFDLNENHLAEFAESANITNRPQEKLETLLLYLKKTEHTKNLFIQYHIV